MHRQAGASPAKGNEADYGMGASTIWGEPKRPRIVQLGEQKAQQDISTMSK